jgi:hypothetical protein
VVKVEPVLSMGTCFSCDDPIAWVKPRNWKKNLALDPTPSEYGEWIVLPDGHRALSLADEEVQHLLGEDCLTEFHDLPRYVSHDTVCRMAGFRSLDWATKNATKHPWQSDQREARRRTLLEADRLRDY